ncbi:MAG: trypsin-like peptidase domain-containing protein [Colwelliaceae bacterium]|nr:trypsin-like peptidase domain-containing protein [Colwelliaceae bacterium]
MKILNILKYILNSASYGVIIAIMMLLLIPELREGNESWWNIFQPSHQNQAISYAKAVQVSSPAVVNIYSEEIQTRPNYARSQRNTTVLGSGVIMDSNGYLLTNYHVVQNATLITVLLQDGQEFHAEVIGYDRFTDLAVLKVKAINLPVIPQNKNQKSLAGDVVLAIGNPLNLGQTITQGIISATGRSGLSNTSYLQFLQIDAAINSGNSGGALVDSNGVLVGINSLKFSELNPNYDIQGISFAVPYKLAHKIMTKIIEHGRVIRGWLGIVSESYNQNLKGFTIKAVEPNSPAFNAGLKAGDIVYQIGDIPIHSTIQALDIVAETAPGTELNFKAYRDKQSLDIKVTILDLE